MRKENKNKNLAWRKENGENKLGMMPRRKKNGVRKKMKKMYKE